MSQEDSGNYIFSCTNCEYEWYDLLGSPERCPECEVSFEVLKAQKQIAIFCKQCNEMIYADIDSYALTEYYSRRITRNAAKQILKRTHHRHEHTDYERALQNATSREDYLWMKNYYSNQS